MEPRVSMPLNTDPLLIVGPHPQYFNGVPGFVDLVDEAVFDVDAPGVGAGEIAD